MLVINAVQKDLDSMPIEYATCGLAASALAMAREIDDPDNSATSKSMCARAMLDTLDKLRELAPKPEERDELDDLSARRASRRSAASAN